MSQKTNPTAIGAFIVLGLALGVAGVVLLSSSRWWTATEEYIAYFDGSLNGLDDGAPVKYRGVTIGYVKRVMVRFNQAPGDKAMPVLIEIHERLIADRVGPGGGGDDEVSLRGRLSENVRATLEAESLVTGVLYVNIEPKANPAPPVKHQLEKIYPEIATEPTQIQRILNQLTKVDLAALADRLTGLVTNLDTRVGEIRTAEISAGLTNLLTSLNRLVSAPDLTNTLASARLAVDQYRIVAEKVSTRVDPLADSASNTLAQATQALIQIRGAADTLRTMLAPDAPLRHDLGFALDELATAARSISALADFLRAHPNALIGGRRRTDLKP